MVSFKLSCVRQAEIQFDRKDIQGKRNSSN